MTTGTVVVVGGGVHGCSAAVHLARAGFDVTVLERQYSGRHASGVNAGGVRRLGRHPAEIPLSVAAFERWQRLAEIIGDDGGFRPCGQVRIAESDNDLELIERRAATVRDLGFDHEIVVSRKELQRRLPHVNTTCAGALVCDGDGAAEPWRTTQAWSRQARRDHARIIEGVAVVDVQPAPGGFDVGVLDDKGQSRSFAANILINCAGAWSGEVSALLGEMAPVKAEALMLSVTERVLPFITPVVGATSRPLSFKQASNGTLIIGGGLKGRANLRLRQGQVDVRKLAPNYRTVIELFPATRTVNVVRTWAGIEAVMPDEIPVLGRSQVHPNLIHSFGYSGHGFQLSAITGEIVRDLALEREPALPIQPFSIKRFSD